MPVADGFFGWRMAMACKFFGGLTSVSRLATAYRTELIGRLTCDREVAGSTLAAALFGQQPWASCSHLMCLWSPSTSITWYLARAFMLKRRTVAGWQRRRVQWTRGVLQSGSESILSNCKEPRYKSSTLGLLLLYLYSTILGIELTQFHEKSPSTMLQESCAIAKMAAQYALYMGALNIFGTPWLRPRLPFPTFFMGFCSDRPYECSYKIWSS